MSTKIKGSSKRVRPAAWHKPLRMKGKINKNNKIISKKEPRIDKVSNEQAKIVIPKKKFQRLKKRNKKLRESMQLMILNKNPFSERAWYHTREPGLYKRINDFHDNMLAEYVYGLFHPDVVYRENLNIKCPSILPIPTSNFAFKETFTITPNAQGNFLLIWSPNYLGSSDKILKMVSGTQPTDKGYFSNVYFDVNSSLDGNSAAVNIEAQTFKHIAQDFNKYRLASACMKVRYTGKKIDQSGMLSACASFMEFPRTVVTTNAFTQMTPTYQIPNLFPQLQRLGDFDTIRQGQWAKTISLVNNPDGITCVYIPTDPLSQSFVDNGDTLTSKDITMFYPPQPGNSLGTYWLSRSANIAYDICGYGIFNPNNVPLITVETFYNFEIIVNEDQMPFFRPTLTNLNQNEANEINGTVNKITSSVGTITTTVKHENPNVFNRISSIINSGISVVDKIAPLIKLGSLLL